MQVLRVLTNTVARGDHRAPAALSVSPDGHCVAFVGPTEFTVTVVSAATLDEVRVRTLQMQKRLKNSPDNGKRAKNSSSSALFATIQWAVSGSQDGQGPFTSNAK